MRSGGTAVDRPGRAAWRDQRRSVLGASDRSSMERVRGADAEHRTLSRIACRSLCVALARACEPAPGEVRAGAACLSCLSWAGAEVSAARCSPLCMQCSSSKLLFVSYTTPGLAPLPPVPGRAPWFWLCFSRPAVCRHPTELGHAGCSMRLITGQSSPRPHHAPRHHLESTTGAGRMCAPAARQPGNNIINRPTDLRPGMG